MTSAEKKLAIHAVILAGGRGTRFWPRSRTRTPKQLLNIVGKQTMLEQTVARLRSLIPPDYTWTVTNAEQVAAVRKQVPWASRRRLLTEPMGRNTAVAIALAAIHARHTEHGDALMAVFPADHYVAQPEKYREIVGAALEVAREPGRMVVLGIPPTTPDTGFGYIERMGEPRQARGLPVFAVRRFTEKPELRAAEEYIASGNYLWNAGMFFWRVSTFLDNLKKFLTNTYQAIDHLSESIGTRGYERKLRDVYRAVENISVDYAILEPATRGQGEARVFVIPTEVGWSDIGSWASVYDLLATNPRENVFTGAGHSIDAEGNFLWSPSKFVAAVGIRNVVVVETPDALLVCSRDRAQDVAKVVKWLEQQRRKNLL